MANIELSSKEKLELENAEKQIKQPQLLKRIQSIKLRDKGMSNIEISDFLMVSDQTISNWAQIYLKEGLNALLQWNYKGKISILSLEHQQVLQKRNKEKPFEKASEAKEFLKEKFGIEFHLHWVQKILKKNFNLHTKKPD
jgi:transposase